MKIVPIEQIRRPPHSGQKPTAESAKAMPGRELATQRDAVMFRAAAELGVLGVNATTPFVVQRLAQLWPTSQLTSPALASAAYSRPAAEATRAASTALALVA